MLRLSFYLAMIEGEAEQHKFEQLYWKFKGLMYYRAYEILQEEQAAEDAVSMAFLRIAQNIHKVGELDDPRTKGLIVTIADHIAIDLYRKRRREREHYAPISELDETSAERTLESELENSLMEAILLLPAQYKNVLLLKYADGYNNREISELLHYSVAKVEKLISRGKKQLHRLLEEVPPL